MIDAISTIFIVGTYTATLYLFSVSPSGVISSLGNSTSFGPNQEALLILPDPVCGNAATLVTSSNNCACDTQNGRAFLSCCTDEGVGVKSARLSFDGALSPLSQIPFDGVGPIHMAGLPSGKVAISNYIGGNASLIDIDGAGVLRADSVVTSAKQEDRSVVHHVNSDPTCGPDARVLAVDSDYPGVVILDPADASVVGIVEFPMRIRRIVQHPRLPVAYVLYEANGTVGQWTWPRCEAWLDGAAAPPAERARFGTMPEGHVGTNKPTSFLLSPDGAFAYTCTRTAFFLPADVPTSRIGVYGLGADGFGTGAVQWEDTGGYNTRDCRLSADGGLLFAVDVVTSKAFVYARDAMTGKLTRTGEVDVPHPTMVERWTATTTEECDVDAVESVLESGSKAGFRGWWVSASIVGIVGMAFTYMSV
eukprot:CAMPEP_0194277116 /NCGR_PEP_ID=MMETSP0169-20130528/9517_1 /TAXON_ID=218684 /ORGANISM="Corethron pennatum, Strain L29A3" /LENGTH=419 /DNA_ID=CAMNT_0039020997 /DNA_START=63 /DNA_END=1322 /DNA_ORIENTATION=-